MGVGGWSWSQLGGGVEGGGREGYEKTVFVRAGLVGFSVWKGCAYKFCNQVSPATIRKREANALAKDPNSMGSSSRKVLTPTMESEEGGGDRTIRHEDDSSKRRAFVKCLGTFRL